MRWSIACLLLLSACAPRPVDPSAEVVLAINLVRTFPGEQADYLRFIETNWAPARAEVQRRGDVVAYDVLARVPSDSEWDVMLITEYASPEAYARREATFGALFRQPAFQMKRVNGKGPRDMAEILGSSVSPARRHLRSR
ncbi:MAG: hypothetical protein AAFQ43_00840 [Bacteroidota bacterium]